MYHKDFIIDLENQMEDCTIENEVLERIVDALDTNKDQMQKYLFALSQQKIKHNNETLELMNNILNDIYKGGGMN
jgi:chromosomal replication initiation ATPase DnaA